jgi:CheY-like chemotaxis protein
VSGYNDHADLERSRAAGYQAHLAKPVDVQKLDETIRRIVRGSATEN